jgi:hypothetical protein
LYTKNVVNELKFLLVTHTTCFSIRFDNYKILKSDFHTDQVLDRLVIHVLDKISETCWGMNTSSEAYLLRFATPTQTQFSDAHNHNYGPFGTTTCGVSGLLENQIIERVGAFGTFMDRNMITTFKLVIKLG